MSQKIIFTNRPAEALDNMLADCGYNRIFIIADENSAKLALPKLADSKIAADAKVIEIPAGDINKGLDSVTKIWSELGANGATRRSLVINVGGGMVTDLGGFAASTFKRGIDFVNIPTTLLGAVDAAVGGKTGINFNGLKNEIGVFNEASAVIISTVFYDTLPVYELKSGFAEMLKHALLSDEESLNKLLKYDFKSHDYDYLLTLLKESVEVKRKVVLEDPHEKGIRRALNLGHTAGHAFESLAMQRKKPVAHGYAVAWGLVAELTVSNMLNSFDSKILTRVTNFIYEQYGAFRITCNDYDIILELMRHDKKSNDGELNFTLLNAVGNVKIDCTVSADDIKNALDIYRDFMHI